MSSHHSHNLGNSQTPAVSSIFLSWQHSCTWETPAESFSFLSMTPFLQLGNHMWNHPTFCHGTILVLGKHLQNHSAFCHDTILATWEPLVESFSVLSQHHSCYSENTCRNSAFCYGTVLALWKQLSVKAHSSVLQLRKHLQNHSASCHGNNTFSLPAKHLQNQ